MPTKKGCPVCGHGAFTPEMVAVEEERFCSAHREALEARAREHVVTSSPPVDRRQTERRRRERRHFPPRPEGRRHGTDRRGAD